MAMMFKEGLELEIRTKLLLQIISKVCFNLNRWKVKHQEVYDHRNSETKAHICGVKKDKSNPYICKY